MTSPPRRPPSEHSTRLRHRSVVRRWLPGAVALLVGVTAQAEPVDLATELARLQASHGFEVRGAEHLEAATGRSEGADVFQRLRLLLERYDHIIVQQPGGAVERVIILGRTLPGTPRTVVSVDPAAESDPADGSGPIELTTIRSGNQHSVEVSLEGPGGQRVERLLLVDTGADSVVLPASMIAALGLDQAALGEREVQTANGKASARVGRLAAVWLGERQVSDVEVAFLDDDKLAGAGLLGMSVLGRYQMTIDDATNRLTLTRP